jgi:chaperonin cofactor prefoldin
MWRNSLTTTRLQQLKDLRAQLMKDFGCSKGIEFEIREVNKKIKEEEELEIQENVKRGVGNNKIKEEQE